MLNFGNNRVTHIYKGTELVDSVRYGKETIFPYNADDLVKYSRLYTDLGYSPKYIRMLQKAGLDLDNLDNDAIDVSMQYKDMGWTNVKRSDFVYFPRLANEYSTSLSWFADYCYYVKSIPLDGIITDKVTSTSYMFCTEGDNNILALDFSSSDTSNVTNMQSMFYNCSSLTSLDVSNFDTSNVTDMVSMFSGCSSLTSLDVSNFDTSNVTDMGSMFWNCFALTHIKCKQAFKDWCITNYQTLSFDNCDETNPNAKPITWEIVD